MTDLPVVNVAVTVFFHQDRVLLMRNPEWGSFTFPMTKIRRRPLGLVPGASQREPGSLAAMRNVGEVLGKTTIQEAGLLCDLFEIQQGDRSGQVGQYNFQIFGFSLRESATKLPGEWLTLDDVLDENRQPISQTARRIAEELRKASQTKARGGTFPPAAGIRDSRASVAVIQRKSGNADQWLLQFNAKWGRFFLIGGHANESEGAKECLKREIQEEIHLEPGQYEIGKEQPLKFRAFSSSAWQDTDYQVSAFDVSLNDESAQKVAQQADNLWVSAHEIRGECTDDGRFISPTVRRIFQELNVL